MRRVVLILACAAAAGRGEIIDRIVAIVGRDMIAQSDVELEARLEAYFRGAKPVERDPEVLERLIRQRLILQEISLAALPEPGPDEVKRWLGQMQPAHVSPGDYGLRSRDLAEYAARHVQVERFLELRFRPGLQVTPEEVEKYYRETFLQEAKRRGVLEIPPLEEVSGQIRQILIEERVTQLVDQWIAEMRGRVRVKVLEQ